MEGVEITNSLTTHATEETIPTIQVPNYDEACAAVAMSTESLGDKSRMINFIITFGDLTKSIELDDTATMDLFNDVASIELGVPRSDLKFEGWPNNIASMPLTSTFGSLNLPSEVHLSLKVIDSDVQSLIKVFKLKVKDITNNKEYELDVSGSQMVGEIKSEITAKTSIREIYQIWSGINLSDVNCTVASLHLDTPFHSCTVRTSQVQTANHFSEEDGSSDDVEYNDDNSLDFMDDNAVSRFTHRSLMPDQASDDIAATRQFHEEFRKRFGDCPIFQIGSLDDALQRAFDVSAKDRKLLAVYLHHDKSILSNVFCSEILCKPIVLDYLADNCVIWGWDMTSEFNRAKFLTISKRLLGKGTSDTISRMGKDEFPALAIVEGRKRTARVTSSIILGHETLDQMMSKLIHSSEEAKLQKMDDLAAEKETEARESIKREQEEAYQMSLMQDMEKQKKLQAEEEEKKQEEDAIRQQEQERQRKIEELQKKLPEEPPVESKDEISTIQFRPPGGGAAFKRKFYAKERLEVLLLFVESKGFTKDRYRVLSAWPKREITSLDASLSLKDHKLFPQDSLIIEEIN